MKKHVEWIIEKIKGARDILIGFLSRGLVLAISFFIFFVGAVMTIKASGSWIHAGVILMIIPFIIMAVVAVWFRPYPGERRG